MYKHIFWNIHFPTWFCTRQFIFLYLLPKWRKVDLKIAHVPLHYKNQLAEMQKKSELEIRKKWHSICTDCGRTLPINFLFTWMLPPDSGGWAVMGQAGSMAFTFTSRAYNFRLGKTTFHVCRSLNIDWRVFSSTWIAQTWKTSRVKRWGRGATGLDEREEIHRKSFTNPTDPLRLTSEYFSKRPEVVSYKNQDRYTLVVQTTSNLAKAICQLISFFELKESDFCNRSRKTIFLSWVSSKFNEVIFIKNRAKAV